MLNFLPTFCLIIQWGDLMRNVARLNNELGRVRLQWNDEDGELKPGAADPNTNVPDEAPRAEKDFEDKHLEQNQKEEPIIDVDTNTADSSAEKAIEHPQDNGAQQALVENKTESEEGSWLQGVVSSLTGSGKSEK